MDVWMEISNGAGINNGATVEISTRTQYTVRTMQRGTIRSSPDRAAPSHRGGACQLIRTDGQSAICRLDKSAIWIIFLASRAQTHEASGMEMVERREAPGPTSLGPRAPRAAGPGNRAWPWARGGPASLVRLRGSRKPSGASRRSIALSPEGTEMETGHRRARAFKQQGRRSLAYSVSRPHSRPRKSNNDRWRGRRVLRLTPFTCCTSSRGRLPDSEAWLEFELMIRRSSLELENHGLASVQVSDLTGLNRLRLLTQPT